MNRINVLSRRAAQLAAVAMLVFASGCSQKPSEPLRIGINAWPGYEFIYLAQEKGFYRDEGVAVRVLEFDSLSDVRRSYERGQLDAMAASVIEVLQVRDKSPRSPQIVQVIDYSDGADVILAQPEIKDGASLRGSRIGVELASLGVYILARGLEKNGLKLSDVKIVSMNQAAMTEAFLNKELDAVVSYPPVSIDLLRDSKVNMVFSTAQISGEVVDIIAIEKEFIADRRQDVEKFLRGYRRAVEYSEKNPADAYRIMAGREKITPEEFRLALTEGMKLLSASDQQEYFRKAGKLFTVVDATDRVLRETLQIIGPDRRADIANGSMVTMHSK